MADHYYTRDPVSGHKPRTFTADMFGTDITFGTDAGVFSRDGVDTGSMALMKAVMPVSGRVLDMGAGWGAIGITLAKLCPDCHVTMAEINSRASELIRHNMELNDVTNADVIETDGFSGVTGLFDVIVTNPPIRAGKKVIYAMFSDAAKHLTEGGTLSIVIRKQQGAPSALKYLSTLYENTGVVYREAGFWVITCSGPIQTERK